jgi:hypothetical protein
MMRVRRGVSSVRRVSAWLVVAAGLVVYAALAAALGLLEVTSALQVPWWAALATPAVVDGLVVRLFVGRVSGLRWLAATLCLWGVHLLLGALTAVTLPGHDPVDAMAAGALLGILWVPLLLLPFRDVIRGSLSIPQRRSPTGRHAGSPHRGPAPATSSSGKQMAAPTTTTARPGAASQPRRPGPVAVSDRPVTEWPGLRAQETVSSTGRRGSADSNPDPKKATDAEAPAGVTSSPPQDAAEDTTPDAAPVLVRVSFDRVAAQFPPGAFQGSLEAIGARLPEPGHLTVPRRLVLAQLPEGFVRAGWEVVAAQFPRDLLAMGDEEITRQLADGQLVLPLDELIPQLPRELFRLKGQAADVESIASIPPPFQPTPTDARTDERAEESSPDGSSRSATRSGQATEDRVYREPPSAEEPVAEVAVLEDAGLDPVMVGAVDDRPESPSIGDGRRQPAGRGLVEGFAGRSRPRREGGITVSPSSHAAPDRTVPDAGARTAMDGVAAALAPLSPLTVGVESAEGVTLLTASTPGRRRTVGAARALFPFLDEDRAPWPVNQLTMWGEASVLVLTPLPSTGQERVLLAAAIPPAGGVAALERLSLRAPGLETGGPVGSPRIVPAQVERGAPSDLVESEPSARARELAASLEAFAPVATTLLRDATAERDLYLFLPEGTDVRLAGWFAGDLDRTVRTLAGVGHAFHAAVLRCGRRRLIVRFPPAAASGAPIVVAGGPTDRAGLAFRQVEAAALLLAAG